MTDGSLRKNVYHTIPIPFPPSDDTSARLTNMNPDERIMNTQVTASGAKSASTYVDRSKHRAAQLRAQGGRYTFKLTCLRL